MAVGHGVDHRVAATLVGGLDVRAFREQRTDDIDVAVERRRHQRRPALLIFDVRIGLVREQQLHGIGVATEGGGGQRACAAGVADGDVRFRVEQHAQDLDAPGRGRLHQRRDAVGILLVHVGAARHECRDGLRVAIHHRIGHRLLTERGRHAECERENAHQPFFNWLAGAASIR
jgi:hypothetical protein